MIIGMFHSADDAGFAGQLFCMGLEHVPVVILPEGKDSYTVLITAQFFTDSVEIGRARHKRGKDGGHLEVTIDGPILPAPVTAMMQFKPSRDGIYTLCWNRAGVITCVGHLPRRRKLSGREWDDFSGACHRRRAPSSECGRCRPYHARRE